MPRSGYATSLLICGALAALVLSGGIAAQDFGDTPYVQTPQPVVDAMLKTAKVTSRDYVIDLGVIEFAQTIAEGSRFRRMSPGHASASKLPMAAMT